MKKTLLFLLAVSFCFRLTANAQQKTSEDSLEVMTAACRDAQGFRLNKKGLEKFHAEHFPVMSDYFKPDSRFPKVLTTDSLFVKTYRVAAFDQALSQKSFRPLLPPLPPHRAQGYFDPVKDIASKDAQRFELSKPLLARFKKERFPPKSDYFKPLAVNASDPALLNDSTYVQTFRLAAYRRADD